MSGYVCCECKKAIGMGMILNNRTPEEPPDECVYRIRDDGSAPWKFIGPNDSCHLECYVDICVQKALERLGR